MTGALRFLVITLHVIALVGSIAAQDVPVGTWRVHISFYSLADVLPTHSKVYAAAQNGVMIVNRQDNSIQFFHKGNGLHNTGVSKIAYDVTSDQLLAAYTDGTFDVIRENRVRFFDPGKNAVITGSKSINSVYVHGTMAYFSTDYGVLIYDLSRNEIKETWRDLGEGGTTVRIIGSTIRDDSVFLATETGIIAGALTDNLLDFNKWKRFAEGNFPQAATSIATVGQAVYAAFREGGLFAYHSGSWSKMEMLPELVFSRLTATDDKLVLTDGTSVWVLDPATNEAAVAYADPESGVVEASLDGTGVLWIATKRRGLLTNETGSFAPIVPNGPAFDETVALHHNGGKIFAVSGGFSTNFEPINNTGKVSVFERGTWSLETPSARDLTSIAFNENGRRFIGSFGFGVIDSDGDASRVWDETNSSLINTQPPGRRVDVTSIANATDGLWVANYAATPPLHFFNYTDNTWESYSFPYGNARYPVKLHADLRNDLWIALDPERGGGLVVFDKVRNQHLILSSQAGQGGLPSDQVYEVVSDRDGNVWVGTDAGVAYFFDKNSDAVKPIFENRFLLRDETVHAIAVDGGNRKWIGTERGVWLFNSTGDQALTNFTIENSPLPSNRIHDIEINPVSGEVFFATDRGIASFRSNATAGGSNFQTVKVFPNPVPGVFAGEVGISGLTTDAVVKITDISGRLIRETRANGGSASWDVRDYKGRRVDTGIYLIMAVAPDGSKSIVGKIAVVN